MLIKAAKKELLARSPSDWVYKIWLTCDDMIAVQFRHGQKVKKVLAEGPGAYDGQGGVPGVCCLYPGTQGDLARELFDLARVWPYAGEWVHQFLYKKFGYLKIVPPLVVGCCGVQTCCPDAILPVVLNATLVDGGSTAGNLSGTYPLTCQRLPPQNEAPGAWTWPLRGPMDPQPPLQLDFFCQGGLWQFDLNDAATEGASSVQCPDDTHPLLITFGPLTAPASPSGFWVMQSATLTP